MSVENSRGIQAGDAVKNKAGSSARKTQKSRFLYGMAVISAILLIHFSSYSKAIGSYGIGAAIIVFVGFVAVIKYLEKIGREKAKRRKDAERFWNLATK